MRQLTRTLSTLAALAFLSVQLSCGSDTSGPDGNAASIDANSATTLTAPPGAAVAELPSIVVHDVSGAPLAGAHVTFAVTSGGGTVSGGNATTDASGIATVGSWTLGATPGTNTLVASIGSLPVVTFTANGADPCTAGTRHTLGSSTNGDLSPNDCAFLDGSFVDFYTVTIPAPGTYVFTQKATQFDAYLLIFNQDFALLGENDNSSATNTNPLLKVLLPAGDYVIAANSLNPNQRGTYVLQSAASTAHVTACEDAFALVGITSSQSLQTTDCGDTAGAYYDDYVIRLAAGQTINITMSSSSIDSFLQIYQVGNPAILGSNDDIDANTKDARLTFTAPNSRYYVIVAKSTAPGVTGPYTLAVQ